MRYPVILVRNYRDRLITVDGDGAPDSIGRLRNATGNVHIVDTLEAIRKQLVGVDCALITFTNLDTDTTAKYIVAYPDSQAAYYARKDDWTLAVTDAN